MARPDGDSFTLLIGLIPELAWIKSSLNFPFHNCLTNDRAVFVQKFTDSSIFAFCLFLPFAFSPIVTDSGQNGADSIG